MGSRGDSGELTGVLARFQVTYQAFRATHAELRRAHEQLAATEAAYVRALCAVALDLDELAAELARHLGEEEAR